MNKFVIIVVFMYYFFFFWSNIFLYYKFAWIISMSFLQNQEHAKGNYKIAGKKNQLTLGISLLKCHNESETMPDEV